MYRKDWKYSYMCTYRGMMMRGPACLTVLTAEGWDTFLSCSKTFLIILFFFQLFFSTNFSWLLETTFPFRVYVYCLWISFYHQMYSILIIFSFLCISYPLSVVHLISLIYHISNSQLDPFSWVCGKLLSNELSSLPKSRTSQANPLFWHIHSIKQIF